MNARLKAEIAAISPDAELVRRMYIMVGPDLNAVFDLVCEQVGYGQMTVAQAQRLHDLFGATYFTELPDEQQAWAGGRPE